MIRSNQLTDHSAHRSADDMRLVNFKGIEHANGIPRHITQIIGRHLPFGEKTLGYQLPDRIGAAHAIKFIGKADIAIVKGDNAKAFVHETIHKVHRPVNQLCGIAHDQQDRWILGIAVIFDFNIDAIGDDLHGLFLINSKSKSVPETTGVTRTPVFAGRAGHPAGPN